MSTDPEFVPSSPTFLFPTTPSFGASFDVSADGQRFLFSVNDFETVEDTAVDPAVDAATNDRPTQRINVILNWFELLKRRVPTGGR